MSPRVEISKRLVFINSSSTLAARILSLTVLLWMHQFLLKRISPEEYSLLPILTSIMMFAPLLTTVLTGGLGRYIVEAHAKGDDRQVAIITTTMFPILMAAGLAFLTAGWMFSWFIGWFLTIPEAGLWDARIMMAILTFTTAIRLPFSPFALGLYVRQKFVLQNVLVLVTEVLRLTLLASFLLGIGPRVLWVVVASAAAEMFNLACTVALSVRLVPALRLARGAFQWSVASELMSFGGWDFVARLFNTLRTSADVLILNAFATPYDVTCFHVGTLVQRNTEGLAGSVRQVLQPSLTAMYANGDLGRLNNAYITIGRYALWAVLFPMVPLIIFAHPIVNLYLGSGFDLTAVVMQWSLLIFPICYGVFSMPDVALAMSRVRGLGVRIAIMNTLNLALTICAVVVLKLGALGSIGASIFAVLVCYPILFYPLVPRLMKAPVTTWIGSSLWPGLLPACFAAAAGLLFGVAYDVAHWYDLIGAFALSSIVYLVALRFVAMGQHDVEQFNRLCRRLAGSIGFKRVDLQT